MTELWSPGFITCITALLAAGLPYLLRSIVLMCLPLLGLAWVFLTPLGIYGQFEYGGLSLALVRLDEWSRIFTIVFLIASFLSVVYSLHIKKSLEAVAGVIYAGAGVGAVLAGDYLTLFVFCEITAISSLFLIWANPGSASFRAGLRYVLIQLFSGALLLVGGALVFKETGQILFDRLDLNSLAGVFVFFALGIKAAFPFLHNWLQDAYPEATPSGTVFLSAFTTKLAIYALGRTFSGNDYLIWIGAAMTAFPIFYAVIENDLRRVLAYSLNNQLGFMVVGIGIGSELAMNGAAAHAFSHILYKGLLFMSMGAVLHRVGTCKGSELGGLYKSMPWTTGFCIVGAASISAFPLFSGFVTKSMILTAAGYEGHIFVWLVLLFASAGVFHHSGIKIPYFAFFGHDSGKRCDEAPLNMLIAMGVSALLCIGIGIFPNDFYTLLPFTVDYQPYTGWHVLSQLQLLLFSALAFSVLMWHKIYPPELRSTNIDFDITYRKWLPNLVNGIVSVFHRAAITMRPITSSLRHQSLQFLKIFQPGGGLAKTPPTGAVALWVTGLLGLYLILNLIMSKV
jgi:multicomponent Na+:H+ antiporter subunit D